MPETSAASPSLTPARRNMLSKLAPLPIVATRSSRGRSGALASGTTAAVAAAAWPLSAPSASGAIMWLRNSSRTSASTDMAGAASTGENPGQPASAMADRPTSVATPRSQRGEPISRPRSVASSKPPHLSEAPSRHSRQRSDRLSERDRRCVVAEEWADVAEAGAVEAAAMRDRSRLAPPEASPRRINTLSCPPCGLNWAGPYCGPVHCAIPWLRCGRLLALRFTRLK